MARKKALIAGVTGQDGAYLSEFLSSKKYEVHGIKRRSSWFNTACINHLFQDPTNCQESFCEITKVYKHIVDHRSISSEFSLCLSGRILENLEIKLESPETNYEAIEITICDEIVPSKIIQK